MRVYIIDARGQALIFLGPLVRALILLNPVYVCVVPVCVVSSSMVDIETRWSSNSVDVSVRELECSICTCQT